MALGGAESDGRADLTGRERFAAALGGDGVAFAPYVWERLPEFVHQPATDWWRDGTTARRLLVDAASLAGADAMVVDACGEALRAVAAGGPGIDVLDGAPGSDVVLDIAAANRVSSASVVGTKWLRKHATTVRGKTVLKLDGEKRKLPRAKLAKLKLGVSKF